MNKKIKIAAIGAIALGSAIVPGQASFAATSQTDDVSITVSSSCTVDRTAGTGTYAETMVSGAMKDTIGSSTLKVICNSPSGWKLQAVGSGTASHTTELYSSVAGSIPTATSGTSYWAFKVTGTDASGATAWTAVPATATTVAKSTSTTAGSTLTTTYKVQLAPAQAAGTYTGAVTYTVSSGAS